MPRDDENKKRRGAGSVGSYIKYGVPAVILMAGAYIVGAGKTTAGLFPAAAGGGSAPTLGAQDVPVPKTPRSVIRYYDGNTVVT